MLDGTDVLPTHFDELVAVVDAFFADGNDVASYGRLSASLAESAIAIGGAELLASARDVWTAELAGTSTHIAHLGFTKVSLHRSPKFGYQVRLNVFWDGSSRDASIHDHRWNLASTVLCGSLRIQNYRTLVDPGETDHAVYAHSFSDANAEGTKEIRDLGQVGLVMTSEYVLHAGSTHTLIYDSPHQVFNCTDGVSATLVVTGPPSREFSTVFTEEPLARSKTPPRERLDRDETIDAVNRVRDAVAVA